MLNPSVTTVWRDDSTLQLGLDPERALVLTSVDRSRAAFLARLDGSRTYVASLAAGEMLGLTHAEAGEVLDLLGQAGLLVDGAARPPTTGLAESERSRLAADQASWSLADVGAEPRADRAAVVLERRRQARVGVQGHGPLLPEVREQLDRAWLGRVRPGDDVRPDLVVLCSDGPLPPTGRAESLLAADVPHLLCTAYEQVAVVGPLVLPGRSPCLTCLELHRTDRDPDWPTVAAQLARPSRTLTGMRRQPGCDTTLTAMAVAATTAAALALVDDPGTPHELAGAQVEIRRSSVLGQRRSWRPHPHCGCHWPGG